MEVLKISSKSNPNSVAGAIAGLVKESNKAEMQAIGAGALNQAVKAVAIARGFVAPAGVDLVCIPAFAEVEVEGEDRTGIKLIVESRKWFLEDIRKYFSNLIIGGTIYLRAPFLYSKVAVNFLKVVEKNAKLLYIYIVQIGNIDLLK